MTFTTIELADRLGFEVDALGTKPFADTEPFIEEGKEILYTGYDIFTHSELQEMYDNNINT